MRTLLALIALVPFAATGAERAGYDSRGRIIALLSDGGDLEVFSNYVAVLPNGNRVSLVDHRVSGGPRTQTQERSWVGAYELPDTSRVRLEWKTQDAPSALNYTTTVSAEGADVTDIELVLDLPRDVFVNGKVTPEGGQPLALPPRKPQGAAIFTGKTAALRFESATGEIALTLRFDAPREASVMDRWDLLGVSHIIPNMPLSEGGQSGTMYYNRTRRSYQIRIPVIGGGAPKGSLSASLALVNNTKSAPVRLTLDRSKPRYSFDGFGGNFCWNLDRSTKGIEAIQDYMLKNLKHGWARFEMKVMAWDAQRDNPGPDLRYDFGMMQQFQKMGVPYVISVWRLPERFYTNGWETSRSTRFRQINPAKWDELNELIGSYLLYARKNYGVEPDLFSFNEPNLGVQVGFTPEGHTEQIKRMGAAFRKLGLKTRMLLSDAVPARDSIPFALDAAADPEAMQYVGAVAVHSWGGAAPEQYAAWGDLAEWLNLPLLLDELGVDSSASESNQWDLYHYGLREAQYMQESLLYARPQGAQFWQYTDSYSLARLRPDGTVEPSARFWLMKHFTDLTPMKSEALATASDQNGVLMTAFRKGSAYALHILNRGGARAATVTGLPDGDWQVTESTEARQFQQRRAGAAKGSLSLELPPRSLVTLTLPN